MRFQPESIEFKLDAQGIGMFSEWLDRIQKDLEVERRNRLRTCLLMEEALLRMHDEKGPDTAVTASLEKFLGRPRLTIVIEGEPYNPLTFNDDEYGDWTSSLRLALGPTPQYHHEQDRNVLRLTLPSPRMNPVLKIGIAILIGVIAGYVGDFALPESVKDAILDVILQPTYDMWIRLLNAISAPIIFFTVITTVLNARSIADQGGNSARSVLRYFAISFCVVALTLVICVPIFNLPMLGTSVNSNLVSDVLDGLLSVIPQSALEPFDTSNTAQLLLTAFVLGYALNAIGQEVDGLKKVIKQVNMVGLHIAKWVSAVVPYIAGLFLCLEIWQHNETVLRGIWLPLVLSLGVSIALLAISILYLHAKTGISPSLAIAKMKGPFAIALKTGSLDASFNETTYSCTRLLGIDERYVKVALPQGLVLYMPVSAVGIFVFTAFLSQFYNVQTDALWYLSAIIMAVMLFVATPPVPGANLLAYVVFFAALGIPSEALMDAMIFDIVFGVFASAANQAMLQVEMASQAQYTGMLDRKLLNAPIA